MDLLAEGENIEDEDKQQQDKTNTVVRTQDSGFLRIRGGLTPFVQEFDLVPRIQMLLEGITAKVRSQSLPGRLMVLTNPCTCEISCSRYFDPMFNAHMLSVGSVKNVKLYSKFDLLCGPYTH